MHICKQQFVVKQTKCKNMFIVCVYNISLISLSRLCFITISQGYLDFDIIRPFKMCVRIILKT